MNTSGCLFNSLVAQAFLSCAAFEDTSHFVPSSFPVTHYVEKSTTTQVSK